MAIERYLLYVVLLSAAKVLQNQTILARQWLNTDDHPDTVGDTASQTQQASRKNNTASTRSSPVKEAYSSVAAEQRSGWDETGESQAGNTLWVQSKLPSRDSTYKEDIQARLDSSLNKYIRHPVTYNTTYDPSEDERLNHFATMQCRQALYNGGHAQMIVYGVANVGVDQASQSSIYVYGGIDQPEEVLNIINAGWHILPQLYNDSTSTRFYTRWTKDGLNNTGCWNALCQGFVQLSGAFVPGSEIHDLSVYNGVQKYITITIFKDPVSSNWFVTYGDNGQQIGYFPKELFNNNFDISDKVHLGGQVFSPLDQPSPPMGSGHRWGEGENKTAYFMNVQLISPTNCFYTPKSSTIISHTDIPAFYSVGERSVTDRYGFKFAYGGPGGYKE